MLIGINIPDQYVGRWMELQRDLGFADFDTFMLNAVGIGVRTMDSIRQTQSNRDNIIVFNSDYYWPSGAVDKK